MRSILISISVIIGLSGNGQDLNAFSLRGELELPVQLGNSDFKNFTESIFNFDLSFQAPIKQGFGAGIGGKGSLTTVNAEGEIYRGVLYVKAFRDNQLGRYTFLETSFKFGRAVYIHDAASCGERKSQTANHMDFGVALNFFANDFTSFGITFGYEIDGASFGPEWVCANETVELYSLKEGNYKYLNIGLGFNVLFGERPQIGPGDVFD